MFSGHFNGRRLLHFGPKYSRIRSVSSHCNSETNNPETYRSGHNGTDSKFFEELAVCSAKKAHKYRVFSGSKIKYFVVLSVSSFQKFLEEMRNYIHGELSEWSKVQHSKFYGCLVVSSAGNARNIRLFGSSNFTI